MESRHAKKGPGFKLKEAQEGKEKPRLGGMTMPSRHSAAKAAAGLAVEKENSRLAQTGLLVPDMQTGGL